MKTRVLLLITFAISVLAIISIAGCGTATIGETKVTKAQYEQIKEGMNYQQVVAIIGEGNEVASSTIDAIPGVMEATTTKVYSWQNGDGSNISLTFQNDKLDLKAQYGLK